MTPIRAVIVDDSATMRGLINATLSRDPEIEVVGMAADALEARHVIKDLNPDVITLDIEMPHMNGLDFLERIMRLRPMPVVMVSTLTQTGAEATIRALELGAVDCVGKPSNTLFSLEGFSDLSERVKNAARASVRALDTAPRRQPVRADYTPTGDLVAIGSSTGGVEALLRVVSDLPANCPPTVIVQHMPESFMSSFAARLDRASAASVKIAATGDVLEVGRVYLAPGGEAHLEVVHDGVLRCRLRRAELVDGHRPSVTALFKSVAEAAGPCALGVILTGMGSDGAEGLLTMRRAGAQTLGQDEASSTIYGMPKAAFELGAVQRQLPIGEIGPQILALTNRRS